MQFNLKKELPLLAVVLLPFLYLAYVWEDLPAKVPMHYNIHGNIDRYGSKQELLLIPFLLPVFIYVIFLIVPRIDPKKQLDKMGKKYNSLKWIMTVFMSLLALSIIYIAKEQSINNTNFVFIAIGALFAVLGNFFKTIRPNYFIGIRTPWTLENENVWKTTHLLSGKLWFIGGILIVISALILRNKYASYVFIGLTTILVLVPIVYSFWKHQQEFKK